MELRFDQTQAVGYNSSSQKIRVMTESWARDNLYCPRCGNPRITRFPNNHKAADFFCNECKNEYELKSKSGTIGHKISDGAYDTFVQRIIGNNNPDIFLLSYDSYDLCVDNLWIIPKHFFTPNLIEKRKPLSSNARRSGWVGCNIIIDHIPEQGRISIVQNRVVVNKDYVVSQVQRSSLLSTNNIDSRGWLLDVLNCVNQISNDVFKLDEIYRFDTQLGLLHPTNNNIRPKIRQQLQILRDKGFIEFVERGVYRKMM